MVSYFLKQLHIVLSKSIIKSAKHRDDFQCGLMLGNNYVNGQLLVFAT